MKLDLNKRDRICFFGDSITSHGMWISEIFQYFKDNYSELEILFFNCGISGSKGREANTKNRMYCDLFNYFPKYAVVMFGMNDVDIFLYPSSNTNPDKEVLKEKNILQYRAALENIVNLCKKENVIPIICSPTPYDEYSDIECENLNADSALKRCCDIAAAIAKENNLLFINQREVIMQHINENPIGEDRIHPNQFGHHLMAENFLVSIGAKDEFEKDMYCTLSNANKKRFEVEQILRSIIWVERDGFGWQYKDSMPICERKGEIARLKKELAGSEVWRKNTYSTYLKYADYRDELLGELIVLTSDMYKKD